ncbi:MAG: MFS transporter [Rhodospirillales bacterium]|nr:MFS transporter [Rhodospirillales bacterium]
MTAHTPSYRALLRNVPVRRLLLSAALARLAGRMFLLTIILHALEITASPAFTGWVSFAALAPGLLSSPISGALLDRLGAARAIVLDMACSAMLTLLLAIGGDSPLLLVGLVAAFSLTSPLSGAGVRTLLPRLVPPAMRDRANALDTLVHGVVDIIGPSVAGLLVALLGARLTLLPIAALYVAAALCLHHVAAEAPGGPRRVAALLQQAADGLASVARIPTLRGLVACYALYEVAWGVMMVAVPVMVGQKIGDGAARDSVTGLLWAGLGTAGILGALLAGHWRALGRERALIGGGMVTTGLALGGAGLAWGWLQGGLPAVACALIAMGAMAGPIDVSVLTLRQRRTPPERLGRVLAVSMSLNQSGAPLGAALGGWLLTYDVGAALPAASLAACLGAVACWRLIPPDDAASEDAAPAVAAGEEEPAAVPAGTKRPSAISPGGPSSGGSSC